MDKGWMSKDKLSIEFQVGVQNFLQFARGHAGEGNPIRCPCKLCGNVKKLMELDVKNNLYFNGMCQSYTTWTWHGERTTSAAPSYMDTDEPSHHHFEWEPVEDAAETAKLVQAARDQYAGNPEMIKKLLEDAEEPLYRGCSKYTKLSATVNLFNLKAKSGWSDKSFTKMLQMMRDMQPSEENILPKNMREVKKTLAVYGMKYEKIDACPNDCILYRKGFSGRKTCPTCGLSRYKLKDNMIEQSNGSPAKVLWYFPPIPRFEKMFQSAETAKNLTWHANEREVDGQLRHPADSPAWKLVDDKWPEFGAEPRNLRLALSADGINPHSSLSSKYSCWPVVLVTYNLPPWLCMKRKFMMLTMLISGPHQPGNDIDIYLAPLIEDLKKLWKKGVKIYDAFQRQKFTLKAILLWTINDFPAFSNLSGACVKGYYACPICGEHTDSCRLKHCMKNVYMAHRRYLPEEHPYRKQKKAFNGKCEFRSAPTPLTGVRIRKKVKTLVTFWGKSDESKRLRANIVHDDVTRCWRKRSIFFRLVYWRHLLLRHNLDVMHIEKNVCDSIIGTLLNIKGKTKDGVASRRDLKEMGLRKELAPERKGLRTYLPPACYTLSKAEKLRVCKTLHELKVPEGYSSNFRPLVSMEDLKLGGLKSHDCHVLMQQLLPVAIRSVLPKHVRYVIIRFCFFFNAICAKVVDLQKLRETQKELVITLCLLEKYFPPSFFDIMVHLTVHLVREVQLCGPVFFRWMYPFERYMKVLKGYVRNRNRPEGCIAECYIAEEAVEFCSEFLSDLGAVGTPHVESNTAKEIISGKPPSGGDLVVVDWKSLEEAHGYVLHNTNVVEPYIEEHMNYLRQNHPRQSKSQKWLHDAHISTFSDWLRKRVSDERSIPGNNVSKTLRWIAQGPHIHVLKYHNYVINGCRFSTKDRDASRVNQNSGVSLVASGMQITSARDKDPLFLESCYYGVITEIWLLDYTKFKLPVFKCDWVENRNGIKVDDLGFILVDLGRIGYKSDSFVFASQVKQVFYVPDQIDPKWSVALATPQRYYDHDNENEDDDFIDDGIGDNIRNEVFPDMESLDVNDDEQSMYGREDCEGIWIAHKPSKKRKAHK